ncbi:3'(2'),5'-bisphosphate nucleotidase CysQ [Blastochloris sulfoviridis]|uniref:3'(2'),5'-bisphosphate nucleotidase CysQ n=1 Tax=Blastochloris sulfoviridis TaxID=50712 RepID=A0A5M6HNT4_9HYPH|nr:3'(2'),5'-bisphosphate nucleotidase CysQ [Blastochloris sulfoviridis]KAA5597259.1 3'(2'),5'-bisphosphate nucleotidase CysQ [Blastochloris sulfoviridis]
MPGADPLADPEAARAALVEAVAEAGDIALRFFRADPRSWTKGAAKSPVTEADVAIDVFLRQRLIARAPAYGWLSEETQDSAERLTRRRLWIVDPIDGTRAYMAGGTDWSISAALVEDGRAIAAVLFAPVSREMFSASRGRGATRNGVPIRAGSRTDPAGARMAGPKQGYPAVTTILADAGQVERVRSLALRIARVAEGTLDAAFAGAGGNDWDLAAADLLMHEAGGRLTTHAGADLVFNRPKPVHGALVAAGAAMHQPLLARLASFVPPPLAERPA